MHELTYSGGKRETEREERREEREWKEID